jgi:hypothetical protein
MNELLKFLGSYRFSDILAKEHIVGSGDLRQMSEHPLPHGEQLSFLHPEELEACVPVS